MGVMDNLLHMDSARVVSLSNGSRSEDRSGILPMENGHCASLRDLPKYKRRRVSAIRDFPSGCGRFVSQTSNRDTVGIVCPDADNLVHPSNHLERAELVSADPEGSLFPESENLKPLECKISSGSKHLNGSDIGAAKKEMSLESGVNTLLPPDLRITVPGISQENSVTKNYPTRRRVSAIRDFPPFCGPNAPRLGKEEFSEMFASLKSLDEENSVTEERSLRVTMETDVKQMEEDGNQLIEEDPDYSLVESNLAIVHGLMASPNCPWRQGKGAFKCNHADVTSESAVVTGESKSKKHDMLPVRKSTFKRKNEAESLDEENFVTEERSLRLNVETDVKQMEEDGNQLIEEDPDYSLVASNLVIVHGLMASSNCPWRQGKGAFKCNRGDVTSEKAVVTGESKSKKQDMLSVCKSIFKRKNKAKSSRRLLSKKNLSPAGEADRAMVPLAIWDEEDSLLNGEENKKFQVDQRSLTFDVNLLPSCPSSSMGKGAYNDVTGARNKVRETLRLFQAVCRKLLQEEEAKANGQNNRKRIDYLAARILKTKGKYVNEGSKIIGSVPGVEVGDEFHYRIELNIIGLHRPIQGGIDYVKHKGKHLATSIVASGGYDDDLDNSDVLTYTGQGGNVINGGREPEDQKLERGNLALLTSKHEQNPVRVIRGETRASDSVRTYIYDGLYLVEKSWQDLGPHGKLVFKFRLARIPGQPELAWKVVKKCKKFKVREGVSVTDISQGQELIPICAVNTIDEEKPPPFTYTTQMIYPDWCHPVPSKGCDCTTICSDSGKCSCAAKNGGEIPYNHNGAIVEVKPLVYECGPACKCPPSCYNRVSQKGIKFQLEVFKTESRGWGVRSLNSISSGSFICEYVGELLEEKEAEKRTGNDEYLFDIGNNNNESSLWDGLSTLIPDTQSTSCCEVVEGGGFTIDAAQYGNVGRFINHSCSPNLYAQNVLYDHEDKRMPHIMLFAAENIPPLQELTYHYNYVIDQVHDSDGNIKKKSCYCGSSECTGRLY
ncbi:hypothetical protein Pint_15767 [Pistacia integerrima]|uniref:Uncharacterized protein n=1 Tax=Pistacia integerrima TaxID=434235 RepID=A0ACC0Z7X9_9ROSI|nr:hypothetical protein Pint_15767 [Pistacia integerrima]